MAYEMSSAWRQRGPDGPARRLVRLAVAACGVAGALVLTGCGSVSEKMSGAAASMPGVGLPANAPERPATVNPYPAVHQMPPQRTTVVLTGAEQSQMESELVAARDQQKEMAAPEPAPQAGKPAKPAAVAKKPAPRGVPVDAPKLVPASSSRTIY